MHGKKHPSKNSHSQSWGPWSDWKWDQNEGKYYAERFDWQGNVEYTWVASAPAADDHHRTPRTEAEIDQLTADLGGLDVNSGYDQSVKYTNQGGPSVNNSIPDIPASPRYTHDTPYHDHHGYSHSHRDKGKGIANAASHDINYDEGHSRFGSVPPTANSYSQHDYPEHLDTVLESDDHGRANSTSFSTGSARDTSSSYYSQSNDHGGTDYELEQALKMSRDELLGNNRTGGTSTSGAHYDSGSIYPGTYELNSNIDPQDGQRTPRGTPIPTRTDFIDTSVIRGTPGNVEPIDNRLKATGFVVEHSYKFQPGEVFKILWSEPTGQVAGDASISDIRAINDPGGQFYVGYRRFIIVSTDESHHSTCVPILTYDRRGCGKKGVRPSKHGIIFAVGQKPRLLKNEPDLGFEPVPLEIYAEGETLARESRVNYSKLVTIEHNVKVFFIGRIPYPYFDSVSHAVDKCWNDKMHKSSKRSRR
ncbi:hypothetical protein F4824DRAFT_504589 [Ustulina deusta]|nr:hypothetical protein F4823DRAFT_562864 [Ustulina deusta]KAI3330942.1 hypothetical protein F4824DRAFT_504589 [Ustulina deusta]